MSTEILDPPMPPGPGTVFRSNSWPQWRWMRSRTPELLLSGHLGSGKTRPLCEKADMRARTYPRARVAICRRYRVDLGLTTLKKYLDEVITPAHRAWGWRPSGEGGSTLHYPNGSEVVFAGLDNPGKVLSSEFDMILFDEAQECEEFTWDTLAGRLRWKTDLGPEGERAYTQLAGCCNPGGRHHFLFTRFRPDLGSHIIRSELPIRLGNKREVPAGQPVYEIILSGATDNQENLDDAYLARLQRYKGKFKDRFVLGLWFDFEGSVYADVWDPDRHIVQRPKEWEAWGGCPPWDWPRYRSFDFGFANPFVCQWWARDDDGTFWRYREIYMSRRTTPTHKRAIEELETAELKAAQEQCVRLGRPAPEWLNVYQSIADHDAGDRAILEDGDFCVSTTAARKDVESGVQTVYQLLSEGRLKFVRGSLVEVDISLEAEEHPTCTEEEMPLLHYPKRQETELAKRQREGPVKEKDHGHDATMYLFDTLFHESLGVEVARG